MSYFAYFARCNDDSLYAGYAVDLAEREKAHNEGAGARYTRARRPVKIVYFEEFSNKSDAMKREYQLKRMTKAQKEAIVAA